MTRAREARGRLALAAVSIGAALLVVEVALRIAGYEPERYPNTARLVDARWRVLLDCYPTNPRGYFDIDLRRPAVREQYFHVAPARFDAVARRAPWAIELRYNSLRFRDVEPAPKLPGVRRLAVLGDSFTEGQGVKEGDTYARVLERRLNAAGAGRWEVRNCGRRGADFPALFDAFEDCLRYEPDVMLYGMVLNDGARSEAFQARQTYLNDWIMDRGNMLDGRPPPHLGRLDSRLAALVKGRMEAFRIGRDTGRWYLEMYGDANREGWQATQGYLRAMKQRMAARGGRLLVASWPLLVNREHEVFASVHATIERLCLEEGIPYHDLGPVLAGRTPPSLWVHPVDMHPNETAHRLAAESLAPVVRDLR